MSHAKDGPYQVFAEETDTKEFDRVGRNEGNMNDIHGEHVKSVRYLTESIRWGNSKRKAEAANKRVAAATGVALDENEDVDDVDVGEEDDPEEAKEEESEEECLI